MNNDKSYTIKLITTKTLLSKQDLLEILEYLWLNADAQVTAADFIDAVNKALFGKQS